MHPYVGIVKTLFEKNANPSLVPAMKKYMRGQFEYLGIKSPQIRMLQRQLIAEHGLPPFENLDVIASQLWDLPQREFQHLAMNLIGKFEKKLEPKFITTLEHLLVTKSWWDTVDALASHPIGMMFKRYPNIKLKYLEKWRKSKNIWLRRTTLLFQLGYKNETDFDLLCDLIRDNLGSEEFFINKAIGWSLRQYAHTNPAPVKKFVNATHELHPLSRREAIKHLGKD